MFRKNSLKYAALFAVALGFFVGIAVQAAVPPQLEKDPVAYFHYLQTSTDPPAVALRKQIENGPADLASAQAAALKEGLILDPAKLQRPLPPEGQNAAPLYIKLAKMLKDRPLSLPIYAQPLRGGQNYTPEQIVAVNRIYTSRPEVWVLLHQAADAPQCVGVRDWKNIFGNVFPALAAYREAERLLTTETCLLAAEGKYADAVKNQTRGFRVAQQVASDPTLINYLVGVACDSIALSGMRDILTQAGPNAEVAAEVLQAIKISHAPLSLRTALAGDMALQSALLEGVRDDLRKNGLSAMESVLSEAAGSEKGTVDFSKATAADKAFAFQWLDASEAILLNRMCALVLASDLPLAARRSVFTSRTETNPSPVFILPNIMLPSFERMADQPARLSAQEAVVLAGAAAIELWTKESGFPASLPGEFVDPFTDKPLGYRLEGVNGFVVYSAGPDGMFDGGKVGVKTPPGQIAFRYPVTNQTVVK